jgi:hypothetical protein
MSRYKSSWHIPYKELLELKEWKEFREKVIERDNHSCTMCKKKQSKKVGNQYYRELSEAEVLETKKHITFDLTGDGGFNVEMTTAQIISEPTDTPIILHVHHRHYVFGYTPWEYPLSAMTTLCHECHFELHNTIIVPVYIDETKRELLSLTPCKRCCGTGFLREYYYYQNGICFRCQGRKYEELIR